MKVLGGVRLSLWLLAAGAVALYVFFISLSDVSPREVTVLTAVVLALATLFTIRNLRVAYELSSRGGDPRLRRSRNRIRERRGF